MSETEQKTNMDKKEIADEEREKMLNAENTKHASAPAETEDSKPKKKIPIGGIKMPGFCRTKSKEPCKEEDSKPTEGDDGASGGAVKEGQNPPTEKPTTPAKDAREKEARKGILDAIRLPLATVFPRKKKETDAELGTTGTAGLASVETLDDTAAEKSAAANEDGMETVRLDGDANDATVPPKQHPLVLCIAAARRNLFVTVATICILISVLVIILVASVGPRRIPVQPLKDGKYLEAVTSCGPVQGVLEDGAFAFRGIPYALPPVNNRRWQPAEPMRRIEHCWKSTYLAHNSSEACLQRDASGKVEGTEDCLYLDVFTPHVRYDTPLPVVVMISAETLSGGSPGVMQPSAKLARVRDMIFVRPNFRLGVFGFLAAEPLTRSTHPPTSGNYGLSDIIAVLQWVQNNIGNFGGNKDSVTVWGHRAGGTLVTSLVGARRAKGLFARAWISSGSAKFPTNELKESEALSQPFLDNVRCSDAACLRKKSADEIMDAVPQSWYKGNTGLPEPKEANDDKRHEWLVMDGNYIQEHIGTIWARDEIPVQIVMGTTAQSGAPASFLQSNTTMDDNQIEQIVQESLLGTLSYHKEALRLYNSTMKGLATMISDIRVVCPLLVFARSRSDVPFYVSTQPRGNMADVDNDVAVILGTYTAITAEEKRHFTAIQQLFNHFIWHGEVVPNDPKGGKRVLMAGQDVLLESDYPNCAYWINKNIVPLYARVD